MMIELVAEVNRAFSVGTWGLANPGALPQARYECCAFSANHKRRCSESLKPSVTGEQSLCAQL